MMSREQGGDDLEDDFEIEDVVVEEGDDDDDGDGGVVASGGFDAGSDDDDDDDDGDDKDVSGGSTSALPSQPPGKRKRSDKPAEGLVFDAASATWIAPSSKKPRSQSAQLTKQQRRQADRKKRSDSYAAKQSEMVRQMYHSPTAAAELVWNSFLEDQGEGLSEDEKDSLKLTGEQMLVGPALDTKPDLAAILLDIEEKVAPANFKQAPKSKGTPRVLILSASAKRSVELCKILNPICKGSKAGKCGKFFGKHKDVKHQQFFLKKESFVYAVGTPARTSALSETGMLKFGALAAVLVDGSWINPLGRTLLEQAESRRDLHLFLKNHLIKHCKSKGTKIVLF